MKFHLYQDIYPYFYKFFRTKRMEQFEEKFTLTANSLILDVGGTEYNWTLISSKPKIVFLNSSIPKGFFGTITGTWLIADGRHLPFKDNTFAIVYSNSVIEHLSTLENQSLFARECRRVGKRFYIQTPNKWFPIEPHYLTIFIHWLPRSIQRHLIRYFSAFGWHHRPSKIDVDLMVNELRLLPFSEVKLLFPEAQIWREKIFGITKSLIAVKNPKS